MMMSLQEGKEGGDDVTHKKNSWQNGTAILQFFQQRLIKKKIFFFYLSKKDTKDNLLLKTYT